MKRLVLVALFGITCTHTNAQEHSFELGYRHLYAPRWDRMVQTYNFARPFLNEPQPLLQHGIGAGYVHTFAGTARLRSGIALDYARFISHAEATGLESRIRLHQLRIGYTARLLPKDLEGPWQVEAGLGIIGHHLSRLVNDEPLEDGDPQQRSLGFGADIQLLVGRRAAWGDACWIVPYIAVNVAPYVHQPTAEVVINQTRGSVAGDGTFLLMATAGVRLTLGSSAAAQ
jgi:hypothetical protein